MRRKPPLGCPLMAHLHLREGELGVVLMSLGKSTHLLISPNDRIKGCQET